MSSLLDDTFSFESGADGLGLIWTRYAHGRPLGPVSETLSDKVSLCHKTHDSVTSWQLWQCQLKYLLIVLCCKVSPQNVSIVRDSEWGPGLRSISTSDSLHFHFNWHLDYQRFNFISVNIKMDELTRSASVSTNISADDHNFNGKLILCYLIYVPHIKSSKFWSSTDLFNLCVQKLEFPLQYFIWVEHKMSIKRPWLWHIMTHTFQRYLENTTNTDSEMLQSEALHWKVFGLGKFYYSIYQSGTDLK